MWKETKVVKNVSQYNFDARYGVYATTDKDKKSILYIGGKEISLMRVGHVRSYEDKVIVQVDDGKWHYDAMLFTKEGELINIVNDTISITSDTNPHYLNNCNRIGLTRYFNLIDIETGRVIFKEGILERCPVVFNDMIFSNRDNIITRYDWDGSILWQHNYEPDFNVTIDLGFVLEGVCGGKLWVKSKHDWHEILLAIDVNTGELIKAFSDSEEDTNLPHCNLGEFEGAYINRENDHILVVTKDNESNYFMNFMDAKTLSVFERTDYNIDLGYGNSEEYIMGISAFCGDFLTLDLECLKDDNTSGFAVYNYKKKDVVFVHRLFSQKETEKGWAISNIEFPFFNNGRIFIHDFADRLHIFEDVKD